MPRWDQQEDISEEPYHSSKAVVSQLFRPAKVTRRDKIDQPAEPCHASPFTALTFPENPLGHLFRLGICFDMGIG